MAESLRKNRDSVAGLDQVLKQARIAAGLSQVEAGQRSEVGQVRISAYEGGRKTPTLAVLYRLAAAYGVDVRELLPPSTNGEALAQLGQPEPAKPKKGKKSGSK